MLVRAARVQACYGDLESRASRSRFDIRSRHISWIGALGARLQSRGARETGGSHAKPQKPQSREDATENLNQRVILRANCSVVDLQSRHSSLELGRV